MAVTIIDKFHVCQIQNSWHICLFVCVGRRSKHIYLLAPREVISLVTPTLGVCSNPFRFTYKTWNRPAPSPWARVCFLASKLPTVPFMHNRNWLNSPGPTFAQWGAWDKQNVWVYAVQLYANVPILQLHSWSTSWSLHSVQVQIT